MRDFISSGRSSSVPLSSLEDGPTESSIMWTTARVNKILEDHENGLIDIKHLKNSPFKDNDPDWKKANIVYEYTAEEIVELKKCQQDVVYFAEKYCQIMTETGVRNIDLLDYQKDVVKNFDRERFNILMASRQVGKTWCSAIFIAWYLVFNFDKNALIVADNAATTKEVIDKIKTIFENMPFFIKPGCLNNAVMSLKFDNGCRLIGRSTTKKTGIGFNIHLLYIDEFAHINEAYLDNFFRSIYPTISASTTSKVILTSTPNGMNKFHEIYAAALDGKNEFVPMRVDWWQFPGRDDAWKAATIANMGSEEDFNQEYGLQFYASDKLLLNSAELKKLDKLKTSYMPTHYPVPEEHVDKLKDFVVHPNFANLTLSDIKNDPNFYIHSIDTSDGLGKDYLVDNIFKFIPLPIKMLLPIRELIRDRTDIFALVQVATMRTNTININNFISNLDYLVYSIFNPENVRLVIELNHKGDYVLNKLEANPQFWPGQVIHSKHSINTEHYKPGLRLNSEEMKSKICERFKYIVSAHRMIPNEFKTIKELGAFGKSRGGTYRSQSGNDDLAITCVNASTFFESPNFWELANEIWERMTYSADPKIIEYIKQLNEQIFNQDEHSNPRNRFFDMNALAELNETPIMRNGKDVNRSFSPEMIELYQKTIADFNAI